MCDPQDAGEIICARELRARVREPGGCRRAIGRSSDSRTRERDVSFHVSRRSPCRSRGHGFSDERRLLVSKSGPGLSSLFLRLLSTAGRREGTRRRRRSANETRQDARELSLTRKRESERFFVYLRDINEENITQTLEARWSCGITLLPNR